MSVYVQPKPIADPTDPLRSVVASVMQIADTTRGGEGARYAVRFRGRLVMDSMAAYDRVAEGFKGQGFTALFRREGDDDVVLAVPGVINPPPSATGVNVLLFGLTVLSMLLVGGSYGYQGPVPSTPESWVRFLLSGWPFLASLLGILLTHELGHYFAARYHKVSVTLPYFIPLPFSPFGTMGAFIRLKSPPVNRRVLLDIGIAGPLAGFVVAVPVVVYGLITSAPLQQIPFNQATGFEGNSILYVLLKYLAFGKLLPEPASYGGLSPLLYMLRYYLLGLPNPAGGLDVFLNQVAWAGWAGLLVTGLNLIPAGQLDGGHALYVLIGKRARLVWPFIIVALLVMGLFWSGWFLWAGLIFLLGRTYAEPLDQITEVDGKRKLLAFLALVLFVLVFTPIPLK